MRIGAVLIHELFSRKHLHFALKFAILISVPGLREHYLCAIVAQLDRAFGSDNCDTAGFRLAFARYSVVCVCKSAVVNGSQTTN